MKQHFAILGPNWYDVTITCAQHVCSTAIGGMLIQQTIMACWWLITTLNLDNYVHLAIVQRVQLVPAYAPVCLLSGPMHPNLYCTWFGCTHGVHIPERWGPDGCCSMCLLPSYSSACLGCMHHDMGGQHRCELGHQCNHEAHECPKWPRCICANKHVSWCCLCHSRMIHQ